LAEGIPSDARKSGFEMMGADSRNYYRRDDLADPAMLWVRDGQEALVGSSGWPEGYARIAAGDVAASMRRCRRALPAIRCADAANRIDLAGRVRQCRVERQAAMPIARESRELLALTRPCRAGNRGGCRSLRQRMVGWPAFGPKEGAVSQRLGQLNLSCAACHDQNWGRKLGGSTIPQGHPTGHPIYRLHAGLASLQRRLRNCLTGVRARAFCPPRRSRAHQS